MVFPPMQTYSRRIFNVFFMHIKFYIVIQGVADVGEYKKRKVEVDMVRLAQALTDYRALQLLKPDKDANPKDMQLLFVKLMGIQSIWLYEGSVDVLRDVMDSEEGDAKATVAQMKQSFEAIKNRLGLELGHYLMVKRDTMSRYNQEMQRFQLTQPIKDGLAKVFQLIGHIGQRMAS